MFFRKRHRNSQDPAPESHDEAFLLPAPEPYDAQRKLGAVLQAISESTSGPSDEVFQRIVDLVVELTEAERGLLILRSKKQVSTDGAWSVRVARLRGGKNQQDPRFSSSVVRRVFSDGEPIRATVHSESEALELGKSAYNLTLRAIMCVPLPTSPGSLGEKSPSEPRGVLLVDSKRATRTFSQEDLTVFAGLAQTIALSLSSERHQHDSSMRVLSNRVFVSHSSQDRPFVETQVVAPLASLSVKAWFAGEHLRASQDWEQVISEELNRCSAVIVVLSPRSVVSPWVRAEVHKALERQDCPILPILAEVCDPATLNFQLDGMHCIHFEGREAEARAELLRFFRDLST